MWAHLKSGPVHLSCLIIFILGWVKEGALRRSEYVVCEESDRADILSVEIIVG